MDTNIVTALITGGAAVVASGVGGYFAGRRGGSHDSSLASGPPPRVVAPHPLDQSIGVPVYDIRPTVTFNDYMDPATINPNTYKLLDLDVLRQVPASVMGGVDYDESTHVATFTPREPLHNGRTYAAIITARVKNQAGNRLEEDKIWHFRTVER